VLTPVLKAPGTKRLKLKYDKLLSSFAFNFNLRRYSKGRGKHGGSAPDLAAEALLRAAGWEADIRRWQQPYIDSAVARPGHPPGDPAANPDDASVSNDLSARRPAWQGGY